MRHDILFTPQAIAAKVRELAQRIVASSFTPHVAAPILVGGYVFAADLLRALAEEGYSLPTDFLWLRSYAGRESTKTMRVLVPPSENFRGRNVLLIDAVLDSGLTLKKARELALQYGASDVRSVVMVDKGLPGALVRADFAGFTGCDAFIVGYGMDDAGANRALPYIAKAK